MISRRNPRYVPHGPDQRQTHQTAGQEPEADGRASPGVRLDPGRPGRPEAGATARSRTGRALDPLHAVYVAVQNFSSVFAERVSVLPECEPYYRVVLDAQENYMPSGPP